MLLVAPAVAREVRSPPDTLLAILRQPGHIALMRHALAPFDGAPREGGRTPDELGSCETQRNLSDIGRADARRIGEVFRAAGVRFERIYASKWCRCRETADLIAERQVENLPLIDSYFGSPDKATRGPAQIAALRHWILTVPAPHERVLLVSHGSLIGDLTGKGTDEGELVIMRRDGAGGLAFVAQGRVTAG
jgi:broad specificity phosphatase PhoE